MGVFNREVEELVMGRVDVDMEISILHIENRKPGSKGKGRDNEGKGDHPETELVNKLVQKAEVQGRAEATPFLRPEEIGGIEALAMVVPWNEFYSATPEEGICFLTEEMRV